MTKLFARLAPLLPVIVAMTIWLIIVSGLFWLFGVAPGALHRIRPWITIFFLWCVWGFVIRCFFGLITEGMLVTPGWQFPIVVVLWPVLFWIL